MDATLKTEIQEIVEVIKSVPEHLQARAFELLLQDAIDRHSGKKQERRDDKGKDAKDDKPDRPKPRPSGDLEPDAVPMRVKAFMKRTKVTAPQIAKLFHIEGDQFVPIWTIQGTKVSKAQVQTALLQSLQRALTSGEFSFNREEVRTECESKKCYDKTNFTANFRNNQKYFSGLEKDGLVSLTDEGMTALAELVTQLAGTGDGE
jgi:hypothetical protein